MYIAIMIAVLITGCGASQPVETKAPSVSEPSATPEATDTPDAPDTTDTAEVADSEGMADSEDPVIGDEYPVSASLVLGNITSTDFSGVVRIDTVDVVDDKGKPVTKNIGYVHHRYGVTVLETLNGTPVKTLTFLVMADADSTPMEKGRHLFVSLCKRDKGLYATPDNAYVFDASPSFMEGLTRALKTAPKGPAASACRD